MRKLKNGMIFLLVFSFVFFNMNTFSVNAENANDQSDSDDKYDNVIINGNEISFLENDTEDCIYKKIISGDYDESEYYTDDDSYKVVDGTRVHGTDNRTVVTNDKIAPYNSILYVLSVFSDGYYYEGTGTLIDDDTVITKARQIYDPSHGYPFKIEVVSVYGDDSNYPYAYTTAAKGIYYTGWNNVTNADAIDTRDIGIIKLHFPLGLYINSLGITTSPSSGSAFGTAGYPVSNPGYPSPMVMMKTSGTLSSVSSYLYFDADAAYGQYGSPLYNSSNKLYSIIIGTSGNYDVGLKIDTTKKNWINSKKNGTIVPIYRVYNPNSKAHFYTKSVSEVQNLLNAGWTYEQAAWFTNASGNSIYRLYNPNSGEHFFTQSASEKNTLVAAGWTYEGVAWYAPSSGLSVYRLYKAGLGAGSHMFTTNTTEVNNLVSQGWTNEGVVFYAMN